MPYLWNVSVFLNIVLSSDFEEVQQKGSRFILKMFKKSCYGHVSLHPLIQSKSVCISLYVIYRNQMIFL